MADKDTNTLELRVFSFGFKYGTPDDINLIFDARFLPNPFWVEELKPKSGLQKEIADYVIGSESGQKFLEHLLPLCKFLVAEFTRAKKETLTIAVGCTGGRHRSVAVVERLKSELTVEFPELQVFHRDIEKDNS